MGIRKYARAERLVVVVGGLMLAVLTLVLAWSHSAGRLTEAHTPHPGLDFTIAVPDADDCDTVGGNATCYIQPGSDFTIEVTLSSLPEGVAQYEGYDLVLEYTGVTSADNASTESWPECGFPATFYRPGFVAMGCALGVPPAEPSTYTGVIGNNDFTCAADGAIALKHGTDNTNLTETIGLIHAEGVDSTETLTIVCGDRPTPTEEPEPTTGPTLPPSGSGVGGDSVDAGLWAVIGSLLAVAAVGIGLVGWRTGRSR